MAKNPIDAINPFPNQEGDTREDRIRRRAYELWEAEGMPAGIEAEHWLAAEREMAGNDHQSPSLGEPTMPSVSVPGIRSADDGGATDAVRAEPDEAGVAPRTAGAPNPAPDTSRSPVANRDVAGPRKAGVSPRPRVKPID
jgi:hypothetical protein